MGEWGGVPRFLNMVQVNSQTGAVNVVFLQGSPQFYPDGVSGLFPQIYQMDKMPKSMFSGGWDFLQTYFPNYQTYNAYSSAPWTSLGLAAAFRHHGNKLI